MCVAVEDRFYVEEGEYGVFIGQRAKVADKAVFLEVGFAQRLISQITVNAMLHEPLIYDQHLLCYCPRLSPYRTGRTQLYTPSPALCYQIVIPLRAIRVWMPQLLYHLTPQSGLRGDPVSHLNLMMVQQARRGGGRQDRFMLSWREWKSEWTDHSASLSH
ncbi:hypothetical protein FGO68_gene5647 [Halteria grandinella]|uniref:Uncharacterized protein n=1 Tax=Halteria grandinella TaxID=5974 RepID=A0A8J8NF67_HALGN|nr:hypothetical protein FGO68_gene5647 [Halteria grandinella]